MVVHWRLTKGRLFTEQTYNACRGLLRVEKQYGKERLDAACRRGLRGAVLPNCSACLNTTTNAVLDNTSNQLFNKKHHRMMNHQSTL